MDLKHYKRWLELPLTVSVPSVWIGEFAARAYLLIAFVYIELTDDTTDTSLNLQSRDPDRRLGDLYTSVPSRFLSLRNVGGWESEDGVRIAEAVASVFALRSRSSSELPFGARRLLT